MDQPRARARRPRAVSELPDARGAAESGRAPDHHVLQRDSGRLELLGLPDCVQRLMARTVPVYIEAATPVSQPDETSRRLALGLMVASGFAALGYQIVWTQQSALWLGHETAAVLAVVAAFFGGIAAGALVLGPRIDRSSKPARWYAVCEAAMGLWSVVLAFLMAPVTRWILDLTGAQPSPAWHWTVAFCGTLLLLMPATAAMGATLPAMERVVARMRGRGTGIAALYAGNTFGAVLG